MSEWLWSKVDEMGIARFVLDNASDWLTNPRPPVNWNDMHGSVQDREDLVRALYNTLREYPIRYTPQKYQPDQAQQIVRRPDEILDRPGEGTCLDLSLLFCGICYGCRLIPWLVRVQQHAFVMISLSHSLPHWKQLSRPEWKGFQLGPLKDASKMKDWIDGGRYVAVECTGFARGKVLGTGPEALNRGPDDLLTFDDARTAGRSQFEVPGRAFEYAIDLAVARYEWKFNCDHLRPPIPPATRMAAATLLTRPVIQPRDLDDLPYLTDRLRQKDAVLDSLDHALESRSGRPSVFLIDGDHDQWHVGLIRRLVKFDLPDWLRLRISDQSLLDVQIELPSRDAVDFDWALRRDIGMKLTLRGGVPSWEEVTARLGDRPGRILFKHTFNTSAWMEDRSARLDRLLQVWQLCGDLDPSRTPIICVQVVYEPLPPARGMRRWLGRAGNPNDAMRAFLDGLDAELKARSKYPAVRAVRLAPLADVTSSDLITWQELDPVRAFCQGADFSAEIDALFAAGAAAGLPMGRIVPHIRDWLRPYAKGI
jgi:hypothetical protein